MRGLYVTALLVLCIGCTRSAEKESPDLEKQAIMETIHSETSAAFNRNYHLWKLRWIHKPYVAKTYINLAENTSSEVVGWQQIDSFVTSYFQSNPKQEVVPQKVEEVNIRLYGNGAWVQFNQYDSLRGLKREVRLMEKTKGEWKIAGMHTTIYGFNNSTNEQEQ